jgi:hypothetical protein
MSMMFQGGPLDQQQGQPDDQQASPGSKFDEIMASVMDLAMSDGQVSADEKLILQQVGTLLQKLQANRVKQQAEAIKGSPTSPAVGQAYAS